MNLILYRFLASVTRLVVRSGRSKDLEDIVLRHQLAVLRRQDACSRLTDDDRSLLAVIAQALPRPRRDGWLVTPTRCCDGTGDASPVTGPSQPADPDDHQPPPRFDTS